MAKILVADDNSNIQKMVALALKDQGIDVVAVGNGEAAVRKMADVHPDLVLADVFMPVRNGYEVCKYVKDDPSLSHIPVILLVGAFDPLDEQEAQRVGADGVLKKPFVPPDPLIAMVKSALTRAGVSYSGAPVDKAVEAAAKKGSDLLVPASGVASAAAVHPVQEAVPEPESESSQEEIPARPAPLKFGSEEQPLAFGSLLETPEVPVEEDPAFMPTAHPDLASDRDWRSAEVEEEVEEEEETPKGSWRRDGGDDVYIDDAVVSSTTDWRATSRDDKPTAKNAEQTQLAEATDHSSATIGETKVASSVIPFSGDAWAAAIAGGSEEKLAAAESSVAEVAVETVKENPALAAPFVVPSAEERKTHLDAQERLADRSEPVFSVPVSPWEAEAQKANQLAATWDAPAAAAPLVHEETKPLVETKTAEGQAGAQETAPVAPWLKEPFAAEVHETNYAPGVAEAESHEASTELAASGFYAAAPEVAAGSALSPATVETIREEAAQAIESKPEETTRTAALQNAGKTAEADMDALVAKVLAKMSPEVLQAVTREILKPVVEAIVRDEINAKKP